MNPDTGTQFHVVRHSDSTSTTVETTHIALDFNAHARRRRRTRTTTSTPRSRTRARGRTSAPSRATRAATTSAPSRSPASAGDSVTVPFTGTAIQWIGPRASNHGMADVYLDGVKVQTVDTAGSGFQAVFYKATGLADGPHTLKIVVTGTHSSSSSGNFVSIDAIDQPVGGGVATYPVVPQEPGTAITVNGRDSHVFVANYKLGDSTLRYSTSELMTNATIGGRDVAVLYGDAGSDGETVLRYASQPTVQRARAAT